MNSRFLLRLYLVMTALIAPDPRVQTSHRVTRNDRGDVPGWVLITIMMSRPVTHTVR